jgi:hypothetical protein
MVTVKGLALIAQLICVAGLIVALAGLRLRRSAPWLFCTVAAFVFLMTTALVIIDSSVS